MKTVNLLFVLNVFVINNSNSEENNQRTLYDYLFEKCGNIESGTDRKLCNLEELNKFIPAIAEDLDDFPIPVMTISDESSNGQIKFDIYLSDMTVKGAKELEFDTFDLDFSTQRIEAVILYPQLKVNGRYRVDAHVTFIPIEGNGTFWITMDDAVEHGSLTYIVNETGQPENFTITQVDFKTGSLKFRFNNLFKDDELLGETVNNVLNEHGNDLLETMKPHLIQRLKPIIEEMTKNTLRSPV